MIVLFVHMHLRIKFKENPRLLHKKMKEFNDFNILFTPEVPS
jgi:hypothetical protein